VNLRNKIAAVAFAFVTAPGCGVLWNSPAEYVVDLRLSPGFVVSEAQNVSVHPVGAFAHSVGGGVEGESNRYWFLGGQVRKSVRQYFVGAEATWAQRRTSFDDDAFDPETTSGWTLAGLASMPLTRGMGLSLDGVGAAGMNKFGGSGPYLRLGVELGLDRQRR
jgi:hypothetical protein